MTDELRRQVEPFLDKTDKYEVSIQPVTIGGVEHLRVKQVGDIDSGEMLLRRDGASLTLAPDEALEAAARERTISAETVCGPSPAADHDKLFRHMLTQVNVFDSSEGPDGGNLACVWVVRHIAKDALNRAITSTDHTGVFGRELRRCYATPFAQSDVLAGGIVISPTVGGNVGPAEGLYLELGRPAGTSASPFETMVTRPWFETIAIAAVVVDH